MVTVMIADSCRRSCIHNNYNNSSKNNNNNDGDKKNTTATKSIFFKGKVTLPLCEIQFTHSKNFFVQNTVFNQMNMLLNNFNSYILILNSGYGMIIIMTVNWPLNAGFMIHIFMGPRLANWPKESSRKNRGIPIRARETK